MTFVNRHTGTSTRFNLEQLIGQLTTLDGARKEKNTSSELELISPKTKYVMLKYLVLYLAHKIHLLLVLCTKCLALGVLLTVCRGGVLPAGGVSLLGGSPCPGGLPARGVSLPEGSPYWGVLPVWGGLPVWGVLPARGVSLPRRVLPAGDPPP